MRVLGIETSCDETAAAIVEAASRRPAVGRIRANVVSVSSPSTAASAASCRRSPRAPISSISTAWSAGAGRGRLGLGDLDAIAATGGPGLIGGVIVGVMTAKALALARDMPFLAVNHLEGHALSARLTDDVTFPYLLLLVSGGHCQLLTVKGPGDFARLGTTIDDAAGECFDKAAKLLGLGFPGGPAVERAATRRRRRSASSCRGRCGASPAATSPSPASRRRCARRSRSCPSDDPQAIADLCASFQRTVGDVLVDRCGNALAARAPRDRSSSPAASPPTPICAAGSRGSPLVRLSPVAPPLKLCTDNGAMIAWAGLERLRRGWSTRSTSRRGRAGRSIPSAKVDSAGMNIDEAILFGTPSSSTIWPTPRR